jgi:hypothetical protein
MEIVVHRRIWRDYHDVEVDCVLCVTAAFAEFVPFIGATLGYVSLSYREYDNEAQTVSQTGGKWLPGVIFCWDIRLTSTNAWLLRTNLRYTPGSRLSVQGADLILPNFEFNFIQFFLNLNRLF